MPTGAASRATPAATADVGSNAGSRASRDVVGGNIQPIQVDGGYSERFVDAAAVRYSSGGGRVQNFNAVIAVTSSDVIVYRTSAVLAALDLVDQASGSACLDVPSAGIARVHHGCPASPPAIATFLEPHPLPDASARAVLISQPCRTGLLVQIKGLELATAQSHCSAQPDRNAPVPPAEWQTALRLAASNRNRRSAMRRRKRRPLNVASSSCVPRQPEASVTVVDRVQLPEHRLR